MSPRWRWVIVKLPGDLFSSRSFCSFLSVAVLSERRAPEERESVQAPEKHLVVYLENFLQLFSPPFVVFLSRWVTTSGSRGFFQADQRFTCASPESPFS